MSIRSTWTTLRTSTNLAELLDAVRVFAVGFLTFLMYTTALIGGLLVGAVTGAVLSPYFLVIAIPFGLYSLIVPLAQKAYRAGQYDAQLRPIAKGLLQLNKGE